MSDQDKLVQASELIDDVRSRNDSPELADASAAVWDASQADQGNDPEPEGQGGGPEPEPDAPQFVSPIPNGAVYGQTKWLPGSLGCDLFIQRGTSVVAPADCLVREVVSGTGLNGGAELILQAQDGSYAWRYRHVQAAVQVGQFVYQGQWVAVVGDGSLDSLGPIPTAWRQWPFPDGWQHLDLSVNQGTDQFAPTGGGGGNIDSAQWMQALGYEGTLITRTPGPPDAGH